jgi:hypothetical protein
METLKDYNGADPEVKAALLVLTQSVDEMQDAELTDGSLFDTTDTVKALNVLIDKLS